MRRWIPEANDGRKGAVEIKTEYSECGLLVCVILPDSQKTEDSISYLMYTHRRLVEGWLYRRPKELRDIH